MTHFYTKMLYVNFKINIDYKEFDITSAETDIKAVAPRGYRFIPVNGGQNRKEYLITPRCYKRILMTVKTQKGEQIRDYYENIEELCTKTYKIIAIIKDKLVEEKEQQLSLSLQQLSIKDSIINDTNNKLEFEQRKVVALTTYNKDLLKYKLQTEKNEYIYIASTKEYAKQGIFKIGRTKELKQRLTQHNSSHINEDENT